MMEEEGLKIECETMEEWRERERESGRLPERCCERWKQQFGEEQKWKEFRKKEKKNVGR